MSEQQMPARIWAISNFGVELWSKEKLPIYDSEQFVRADIAERMAEALEKVRSYNVDIAAGRINYRPHDHIQVIDAALSAFKDSAQETRHE